MRSFTLCEALATVRYWVIFVAFAVGVGCGITVLDAMGDIVRALASAADDDGSDAAADAAAADAIALFSAFNALGRTGFGVLSTRLQRRHAVSRLAVLGANCALMSGAMMLWAARARSCTRRPR